MLCVVNAGGVAKEKHANKPTVLMKMSPSFIHLIEQLMKDFFFFFLNLRFLLTVWNDWGNQALVCLNSGLFKRFLTSADVNQDPLSTFSQYLAFNSMKYSKISLKMRHISSVDSLACFPSDLHCWLRCFTSDSGSLSAQIAPAAWTRFKCYLNI